MALTDFTTFEDIRAALGVSSDELEDDTLNLSLYEFNLKDDLTEVGEEAVPNSDLITDFRTADAKSPGTRTAAETRLVEATRLFSTYVVARQCTSALPLFSPKEQSDGKASLVRYASNPYEHTVREVKALYDKYRGRLITAYTKLKSVTSPTLTARSYFSVVSPTTDPVTGS